MLKFLTLTTFLFTASILVAAQDADLLRHFDYDQKAPLDIHEVGVEHRGNVAIHDLSYASPKGGRVPAYLVVPSGTGPFAAVLWGHWYMPGSEFLNRKEFLAEAVALAPSGVVSLMIDGPIARPGYVPDNTPLSEHEINERVQAIVDMRRGADLLLARADVDPKRLAYVGHSYNAETGAFLSGIDRRFKCFVLMAGAMSNEVTFKSRELQDFRKQVGPEKFDAFVSNYAWLDQGKYVSHAAPAYVFLQYASQEDFLTPERDREYAAVVSDPKMFKLYDAPHSLNADARRDRIAFLAQQLHFTPPSATVIANVPSLPQPSAHEQALAPTPRIVDLKAYDGTLLKATYFAAAKPGPGVLLYHQSNRSRSSWNDFARQLAEAGINTLTVDSRGYGESGGEKTARERWLSQDLDTAFEYLASQQGVQRNAIGVGGAGWLGVDNSVETARRHPAEVKSLVLISGETLRDGLQFLHQAPQLPELFVFSDNDEYPPTQDAMKLLYGAASSPSKKLVHYSAAKDAPWLWYETSDPTKVPAHGGHGTDMFPVHPELPAIIVQWFVTTLIKTPGHAPADGLAAGSLLNQLQFSGEASQVKQQLIEARKKDPQAQLWPEAAVDIIGEDYQRAGDIKHAIEIFQLNLLAYPDSADAHGNLADTYLKDGQKELARKYAEKALALLDSHAAPASSWSDTEGRRAEIRKGIEDVLKQVGEK